MSGVLYAMKYVGNTGMGLGCIYVGNGKILGMDASGGRYDGSYTEQNNQMEVALKLTMIVDGILVTGARAPKGTTLDLAATWQSTFGDGKPQPINVGGGAVQVTFEKIGEV